MTDEEMALEYGELHDQDVCGLFLDGLPCCPKCFLEGVTEDGEAKAMQIMRREYHLPPLRRDGLAPRDERSGRPG